MMKIDFFSESRVQNRLLWYIFVANYGGIGPIKSIKQVYRLLIQQNIIKE